MSEQSLYDRLGGIYAITGTVDILVDRLFANAPVDANEGVHAHHGDPANAPGYTFPVTAWSVQAAGGPRCYPGMDMVTAHETLKITDEQFDAVALEISAMLNSCEVPTPEHTEFVEIIESYRSEVVEQRPKAA